MTTKYILTGAKGLIASFLDERLQKRGWESALSIDARNGFDVRDLKMPVLDKYAEGVEYFFHLAAHCKIREGTANPRLPHENNADGTFEAINYCHRNGIPKFVYFSSSRVLSKERNPYVASKIYGEELCKSAQECWGLEYVIIRPSTVYGPYLDITGRLITDWTKNALEGKPLVIMGDVNKTLDFTHIDDFLDGLDLIIDNWEQTKNQDYNISGATETKLVDLADMLKRKVGKVNIKFSPAEIAQPQQVNVDIAKMRVLGYSPKIELDEGVDQLVELYSKHYGKKKDGKK